MNLKIALLASIAVLYSAPSYSLVIDFQQLERNVSGLFRVAVGTNMYFEDGFRIDYLGNRPNDGFYSLGTGDSRYTGSTALFNNTPGGDTQLSQVGGGAFDLISIELAKIDGMSFDDVTFTRDGGHSQTFSSDGISVTEIFLFDSGFRGSSFVTWTQAAANTGFVQFDIINVSAVPVPAALWLFGSGLGLLGWVRRRKATHC